MRKTPSWTPLDYAWQMAQLARHWRTAVLLISGLPGRSAPAGLLRQKIEEACLHVLGPIPEVLDLLLQSVDRLSA
jgi:hypothetical protein